MEYFDFTAIDFETMTAERTSACAIGIVRVENNVIVQKFYSLIKPIPDNRESNNTHVHGITPEMVAKAPSWLDLWPWVKEYFEDQTIVAHNAEFDLDVLDRISDYYGIDFPIKDYVDTMQITHLGLSDSCVLSGISLDNHHDALCDATACAQIMLTCFGVRPSEPRSTMKQLQKERKIREDLSETKKPLEAEEVANKDTPFFQKKVVLTGVLSSFPIREEVACMLKRYGADINGSISKKTNIVIVGNGCGPSKMKKIEELQKQGVEIKVIYEPEFLEIIEKYQIK